MTTLIAADDSGLTMSDVCEYLGMSHNAFYIFTVEYNCRIGQTFFNCLSDSDKDKLRGSVFDPFYSDQETIIIRALIFLLEN